MLSIGIQHTLILTVTQTETAKFVQSGGMEVLATPVLINCMEKCAWQSILPHLAENTDTVGTFIEIHHLAPTPIGMQIKCISELIEINNRELVFNIEAFDDVEKIAQATHKRFIIQCDKFQNKANMKLK